MRQPRAPEIRTKVIQRETERLELNKEGHVAIGKRELIQCPLFRSDGTQIVDGDEYYIQTLLYSLQPVVQGEILALMMKGRRGIKVSYKVSVEMSDKFWFTIKMGAILEWGVEDFSGMEDIINRGPVDHPTGTSCGPIGSGLE